jgi:hypothetical protein
MVLEGQEDTLRERAKNYMKGLVMQKLVALNEKGARIGQEHPGAKLTDAEVAVLLDLRDEGFSYSWLAAKFEVSKSCARWICTGRNRSQTVARTIRVSVPG